jgi:hypothetical protein
MRALYLLPVLTLLICCSPGSPKEIESKFVKCLHAYFTEQSSKRPEFIPSQRGYFAEKENLRIFSTYFFIEGEYTLENLKEKLLPQGGRGIEDRAKRRLLDRLKKELRRVNFYGRKGFELKTEKGLPARAIVRYIRQQWFYDRRAKIYMGRYRKFFATDPEYEMPQEYINAEKVKGYYRRSASFACKQEFIFDGRVVRPVGKPEEKSIHTEFF